MIVEPIVDTPTCQARAALLEPALYHQSIIANILLCFTIVTSVVKVQSKATKKAKGRWGWSGGHEAKEIRWISFRHSQNT